MIRLVDSGKWDTVILVDGLPDDLLHISYGNDEIVDQMYSKPGSDCWTRSRKDV